ncbi:MAG: DUF1345 domain-containing protein [Luteolibacter sp.]
MNSSTSRPASAWRRFIEAEAHHHLATALVVGLGTLAGTFTKFRLPVSLSISWTAFAITSLMLAWGGMLAHGAKARVRKAHLEDSNRATIASCLIIAALASLLAAGGLLATAKTLSGGEVIGHVLLAAATVISSWLLVHTLLAVHYTHLFYSTRQAGGLEFPNEVEPDFLDFAYFSFVIGMTFQVSDVQVTSTRMRRVVLLHSMLSFLFNTVIVAFSINLATTLL